MILWDARIVPSVTDVALRVEQYVRNAWRHDGWRELHGRPSWDEVSGNLILTFHNGRGNQSVQYEIDMQGRTRHYPNLGTGEGWSEWDRTVVDHVTSTAPYNQVRVR